jgi:hypothetical protein
MPDAIMTLLHSDDFLPGTQTLHLLYVGKHGDFFVDCLLFFFSF